jgi:hypothetical protein
MTTKLGDETYLGGGLYVSFDGWYVILRAPRDDGKETWVALEPPVVSYDGRCWARPYMLPICNMG